MRWKTSAARLLPLAPSMLALWAAGCSGAAVPVHTVSYFRAHAKEREAMVQRCSDDPGTLGKTANCVNADRAESLVGIGSFRNLPPLALPSAPERAGAASRGTQPTP
jgi:hypothetical protein